MIARYEAAAFLRVQIESASAVEEADKRLTGLGMKDMPFDGKRMIFGGFKVMVDA